MLIKSFPLVFTGELQLHRGSCTPVDASGLWNLISSLFIPLRSASCRLAKDVCQAVTSLQPLKVQLSVGTNTSCHQCRCCYRYCCGDLGLASQRDFENKTSEEFVFTPSPPPHVFIIYQFRHRCLISAFSGMKNFWWINDERQVESEAGPVESKCRKLR